MEQIVDGTQEPVDGSALQGGRPRLPSPIPTPPLATDPTHRPSRTDSPSGHLPTLDGWRGVAILLVILCHGKKALFPAGTLSGVAEDRLGGLGGHGVELFFAISGLLICYKLAEEKAAHGRLDFVTFYARRMFRLLPAAGLFLIVAYGCSLAGFIDVSGSEVMAALFFYRNYYSAYYSPTGEDGYYTGHFWSLSVEEHFYLALPWLIAFGRHKTVQAALPVLAVAIAGWRAVDLRLGITVATFPGFDVRRTDLCLDHLAWGAFFGLLLAAPASRRAISGVAHPVVRWSLVGLLLVDLFYQLPARKAWVAFITPAALAGTILAPGSLLGRLLEKRLLAWVGRISYSLYLWQQLYLTNSEPATVATGPLGWLQDFPFGLPAAFATAAASYYLVEQPIRRWGYRWIRHADLSKKWMTATAFVGPYKSTSAF